MRIIRDAQFLLIFAHFSYPSYPIEHAKKCPKNQCPENILNFMLTKYFFIDKTPDANFFYGLVSQNF